MSGPYRLEVREGFPCVAGPGLDVADNDLCEMPNVERAARIANAAYAAGKAEGAKAERVALAERLRRASGTKCPLCCEEFLRLADELEKEADRGQ